MHMLVHFQPTVCLVAYLDMLNSILYRFYFTPPMHEYEIAFTPVLIISEVPITHMHIYHMYQMVNVQFVIAYTPVSYVANFF